MSEPRRTLLLAVVISLGAAAALTVSLYSLGSIPSIPLAWLAAAGIGSLLLIPALLQQRVVSRKISDERELNQWVRSILDRDDRHAPPGPGLSSESRTLIRNVESLGLLAVDRLRAVEEQRAVNRQILDSLREGIVAVDLERKVVYANSLATKLFGIESEPVGRSLVEVWRNRAVYSAFDEALEGSESSGRISIGLAGEERLLEMRVVPMSGSAGVAAIGFFIDVSRVERLERIRKDFLDDFSHEVRTPLAGLRSAAESFETGPLNAVQEQQLRSIILRQLSRLERLVGDLSELNRIESGELILDRRPTELRTLLLELCEEFNRRLSLERRVEVRGTNVSALVDPLRVQQIFVNLIDNAIKYGSDQEGALVELREGNGEAIVTVSDKGEGIPRQELDRVFRRFHRLDRSRSQEVPGIGLGLAITRHLVLIHGGSISVQSEEGKGTTFEVRFPSIKESPAGVETAGSAGPWL